ncbi:hypothetical protein I552_6144 [Mycobacterium xenopi 3993]|nr:hypothetical protein I552_6144 [Mycobacterium xenopi 3993]
MEANQLAPEIWRELSTLDRATADTVARHLVAAGVLIDDDPEAALSHARAARPDPAGSPPFAKPSGSRPTTAVTGPKHSPSCAPPAGWAASPRCFR